MEKSSKAGPNDPFSTSRKGRTVALTKMIFKKKTLSRTIEAKTSTAAASVCFLHVVSAVFILAVDLKRKYLFSL